MPSIVKELNLNKHPKDCKDLSLINARNIMVSDDFSCLQNEQSILANSEIQSYIGNRRVVGYIPCNEEVVFFIIDDNGAQGNYKINGYVDCTIARYFEKDNDWLTLTENFHYHGGDIKGAFTYNINGELIIAVAESNSYKNDVPLKSFNLGTKENPNIYDLKDINQPLNPIVKIPSIANFEYVPGKTYKGWYHFFIRYKINKNDYTKWYHIGYPIFVCNTEKQNIFRYGFAYEDSNIEYNKYSTTGCLDYFSTKSGITNETVKLSLNLENEFITDGSNYIQIGFICVAKDSTKAFKTLDLPVDESTIYDFAVLIEKCEEYNVSSLTTEYFNYYNVGNVVNYKNRLYISNYNEHVAEIPNSITDKITLHCYNTNGFNVKDKFKQTTKVESYINGDYKNYAVVSQEKPLNEEDLNGTENQISKAAFINTNNSLQTRKKYSTLIPGEVYSFYIHFVNKYGEATDGYKLKNENVQTCKIYWENSYITMPLNQNMFYKTPGGEYKMYFAGNEVYSMDGITIDNFKTVIESKYKHLSSIPDIKWQNLPLTVKEYDAYSRFIPFVNSNGDYLFKVPFLEYNGDNKRLIQSYQNFVPAIHFDTDFKLPDGYIGYYLSYEKFEKTIKHVGLLSKYDASNVTEGDKTSQYFPYNYKGSINNIEFLQFYSDNVNDSDLSFNALFTTRNYYNDKFIRHNPTYIYEPNGYYDNAKVEFASKLNVFEDGAFKSVADNISNYDYISVKNPQLAVAGDYKVGHEDIGNSIIIKTNEDVSNLFVNEYIDLYKAYCVKITNDLYISNNKTLIKFTDVIYDIETKYFYWGLNGHHTYNCFLVYDWNKFIINDSKKNIINNYGFDYFKGTKGDIREKPKPPLFYVQLKMCDDYLHEAKQYNNEPQVYPQQIYTPSTDYNYNSFAKNIIPLPSDDVDRFINKYDCQTSLHPKTYTNYISNNYINRYDKRVRRSNIISDESKVNSWRQFPLEGYKDISENKGNITNIVGIGNSFLVHTQHSLFAFSINDTLQTQDKDIKLYTPDVFDVSYQEVFTSELGVCGLQDDKSWIVDQFGYIFYDDDSHRFFQYGQGKVTNIDNDIVQFLNKYKPSGIRFAHDKEHNRLLIHLNVPKRVIYPKSSDEYTISFNYALMKWISFHDYRFDRSFNTKNILYLLMDTPDTVVNTTIYNILRETTVGLVNNTGYNIDYNRFQNIVANLKPYEGMNKIIFNHFDSKLDIICNPTYDEIKYLEFIKYKLTKIEAPNNSDIDYSPSPVEEISAPYSGHSIRVFNDLVDTGIVDTLIDKEENKNISVLNYKKPWWNLGVWNYNYLRDISNVYFTGEIPSRIYGNYFIISFVLHDYVRERNIGRRIEFEGLEYSISKDKQ